MLGWLQFTNPTLTLTIACVFTMDCVSYGDCVRTRETSKRSKYLCVFFSFFSLPHHSQALKVFQLKFQIQETHCGFRGSDSKPSAHAAAKLQDGARSQTTTAAPCFLSPSGC